MDDPLHRDHASLTLPIKGRGLDGVKAPSRRGSVYVAVLGVAMIISIIALTSLHASRMEIDLLVTGDQISVAELSAQSAVEFALSRITIDPNWRDSYTSGEENPANSWTSLGTAGSFKFVIADDDNDLNDNANDPVTVRGIGRCGEATSVASVLLQPGGAALNCLDAALHTGGDLFTMGETITCNQMVSSNDDIFANGGNITGDAWAVDLIQGGVAGLAYPNMSPPREMPDTATVFDYYLANGTLISISSIPSNRIEHTLITAGNNPYGAENPQGIYIIDCQGQKLEIEDSRIQATLVLINSTFTHEIDNKIHWEPPAANYPSLMVLGDLEVRFDGGSAVSEASLGVNFNPASSPYLGNSDSDSTDVYAGVIKGLVYVTGNLLVSEDCVVEGTMVVGGWANVTAGLNLTYDPPNRNNPPPGFSSGAGMRIVPGTWRRTSY